MLEYAREYVTWEMNECPCRPIISREKKDKERAHFTSHLNGLSIPMICDILKICQAQTGAMSEKRIAALMNPLLSDSNSAGGPAPSKGNPFPVMHDLHALSASLVLRNKLLARPEGLNDSGDAGQPDDFVFYPFLAVKNCRQILNHFTHIIAIELTAAATLLMHRMTGRSKVRPGTGSAKIMDALKKCVTLNTKSLYTAQDLEKIVNSLKDGEISSVIDRLLA